MKEFLFEPEKQFNKLNSELEHSLSNLGLDKNFERKWDLHCDSTSIKKKLKGIYQNKNQSGSCLNLYE